MQPSDVYLDAEFRIQQALASQAEELDLGFLRLKDGDLPDLLGQLTQLRSLNLSRNHLTAWPQALNSLASLKSLNLYDNQLSVIPESIADLTALESLSLAGNEIRAFPESLGRLDRLESLSIANNGLVELPESIGRLAGLLSLDLDANALTLLPKSLHGLAKLRSLRVGSNRLAAIPEWLFDLVQLESLDLNNNELTALPEALGKLVKLQSLHVEKNQLASLPEQIGQLLQLRFLRLSENKLVSLPDTVFGLDNLQLLDVSSNQLSVLPDSLGRLANLRSLNLSANYLTTLPESLGELKQLQSLSIDNNDTQSLPESLGALKRLHSLSLSGNLLRTLPDSLGELSLLERLRLSANPLETLPDSLCQLGRLQSLIINNDRDESRLTALPQALGQLKRLITLSLAGNWLAALPDSLGGLSKLESLDASGNELTALPGSFGELAQLQKLNLSSNQLTVLPDSFFRLVNLQSIDLSGNPLTMLPEALSQLVKLELLTLYDNQFVETPTALKTLPRLESLRINRPAGVFPDLRGSTSLKRLYVEMSEQPCIPDWISTLAKLEALSVWGNAILDVPASLLELKNLNALDLGNNPLNPELDAACSEGLDAVRRYLIAKGLHQVAINEAKLILVGEGEVGKSCLLGALRGEAWEQGRPSTHGIEIKTVQVAHPDGGTKITLNGWDFGGQRVYRPTHQLFFSSPAVYLVVWKPREGPQQGFVKEWIKLVKHREPEARILVVATHGGPKERQPDIDRQEIWDLFGRNTVVDFLSVDSRPEDNTGEQSGIAALRDAIARVAAGLPEMRRSFPESWQRARKRLRATRSAYLPLSEVLALCKELEIQEADARLLLRICHRIGDLIHYEHDPALRDIVVLKPDWLSTAISYVLEDKQTRASNGLVKFSRLDEVWNDPARPAESRYDPSLHPLFLRLMERFDLSYKVALPSEPLDAHGFWQRTGEAGHGLHPYTPPEVPNYTSLIAQLVPDVRPERLEGWPAEPASRDCQQVQICRIVDARDGQSAAAEGLFYQLIVRLHKYSLGRVDYQQAVHWQRGLVLDNDYNGRALLEHVGNDVRITVRAAYPNSFLAVLTGEVKWLVENFWKGVRCDVMVPCVDPCGRNAPGTGLYDVRNLIDSKRTEGAEKFPCAVCNRWQNIDALLRNAPAARTQPMEQVLEAMLSKGLAGVREQLMALRGEALERFAELDVATQRILSKVDDAYNGLIIALSDEAKEGPRLFSFEPMETGFWDRPKWVSARFRVTLWCEHSKLPLPVLNGDDSSGVYELTLPREWLLQAAPLLKLVTGTLALVLPVAASVTKLVLDDKAFKGIERQLDFGQKSIESMLKGSDKAAEWLIEGEAPDVDRGNAIEARGAALRQFHVWLKKEDPSFGGLSRVMNKQKAFLWVHPKFQFEPEY